MACTYFYFTGLTPNSSNPLNAVQVYRSVPILLSSEQEIDCEVAQNTKITWTIFKFEDDPQMLVTVPGLAVGNLRKSVFRENIDSAELSLPSRELPYGFFEITARLEMKDLPDVFGSDSMYVEVVQTPWLQAGVTAGSFYTVPYALLVSTTCGCNRFCFSKAPPHTHTHTRRGSSMRRDFCFQMSTNLLLQNFIENFITTELLDSYTF